MDSEKMRVVCPTGAAEGSIIEVNVSMKVSDIGTLLQTCVYTNGVCPEDFGCIEWPKLSGELQKIYDKDKLQPIVSPRCQNSYCIDHE